jgi:hypothetical protein
MQGLDDKLGKQTSNTDYDGLGFNPFPNSKYLACHF